MAYFFGFSPSFFEFCAFCLWLLARKYVKIDVKKNAPSGQELFIRYSFSPKVVSQVGACFFGGDFAMRS